VKKLIILTLICLTAFCLFATTPRSYVQQLVNDKDGGVVLGVENSSKETSPDYVFSAYITARPAEVLSTETHPANSIRVCRIGNGEGFPYATLAYLQFGAFYAPWSAGDTIRFTLKHIASKDSVQWELVIPDATTNAIGYKQPLNPIESITAPPWAEKEKSPVKNN
jgi:hypothetical protein